jgi:RNA polymerase sigma factor (sigma-70 family)
LLHFVAQFCRLAATILVGMVDQTEGQLDDPDAINWAAILQQHWSWLKTVVSARVGEPQAVDDVMQEVSLAAVRQRQPLADPSKMGPWLYQLAVRQSLLYRRKQGRRRKLNARYAQQVPLGVEDGRPVDLLARLTAEERRESVRHAFAHLHRRDAEILLLKYVHRWSYGEMIKHLGISHSAVANRLRRARGRLRAELARLGINEAES